MKINFERAKLLMETIVEAGKHGPVFQKIAGEAHAELKRMMEDEKDYPKVVTPPAGPADGAIERYPGAPLEHLTQKQPSSTVEGRLDEVTGQPVPVGMPGKGENTDWSAEDRARAIESNRIRDASIRHPDGTSIERKI